MEYDFNHVERDVNATKHMQFSSRAHVFAIGERMRFFELGESVVRLRRRAFQSFLRDSSSESTSLTFEQVLGLKKSTVLIYSSLDQTKVVTEAFSTNSFTLRADWLLPMYRDWFTPSIGMGLTISDPVNDRDNRGIENNLNPVIRLSRAISKNWRVNSRFEHQRNNSKDKERFAYKKNLVGLEMEYLY
jgi:hypothetical protein